MPEPYYIGLDIGTGSTKAVAYNSRLETLFESHYSYKGISSKPGYYELDPEIIWHGVLFCIKTIQDQIPYPPKAIGLSSAMHGLMIMGKNGEILSPILTWADNRSAWIAESLRMEPDAERFYQKSGTPIHAMSPFCKIIWLKENHPELWDTPICFVSIKSFIWFRFFGLFEEDWSMASATGLMDIQAKTWYSPALKRAGIKEDQLPVLVSTWFCRTNIISQEALNHGIEKDIPIVIGASDGCTASLGSFTLNPGTGSITIGTSGAVRICSQEPLFDFSTMIFNYILDNQIWVCGGAINNGGLAMDWGIQNFIEDPHKRNYQECFQRIQEIPAGSEGLLFLPYLTGERAPIWDENAKGAFLGIRLKHHSGHFLRAVVEGICFAMNQVLEVLETKSNPIHTVHISGGFTESPEWVQILADITGKKFYLLAKKDASTLGAAILSMQGIQALENFEDLPIPEIIREYVPVLDYAQIYKERFQVFKEVFPRLKTALESLS